MLKSNMSIISLILGLVGFVSSCIIILLKNKNEETFKSRKSYLLLSILVALSGFMCSRVESYDLNNRLHRIETTSTTIQDNTIRIVNYIDSDFEEQVFSRNDVFFRDEIFWVEMNARTEGNTSWSSTVDAKVGDVVEFQAIYTNKTSKNAENVMVRVVLPDNLAYVEDSTILYNSSNLTGAKVLDNTLCTNGINIGNYAPDGNAFIRFRTIVTDTSLVEGNNQLINWVTITSGEKVLYDSSSVYVKK